MGFEEHKNKRIIYVANDCHKHLKPSDLGREEGPIDSDTAKHFVTGHEIFHYLVDVYLSSKGIEPKTKGIGADTEECLADEFGKAVTFGMKDISQRTEENLLYAQEALGRDLGELIEKIRQQPGIRELEKLLAVETGLAVEIIDNLSSDEISLRTLGVTGYLEHVASEPAQRAIADGNTPATRTTQPVSQLPINDPINDPIARLLMISQQAGGTNQQPDIPKASPLAGEKLRRKEKEMRSSA
jgi:hypothetical protein